VLNRLMGRQKVPALTAVALAPGPKASATPPQSPAHGRRRNEDRGCCPPATPVLPATEERHARPPGGRSPRASMKACRLGRRSQKPGGAHSRVLRAQAERRLAVGLDRTKSNEFEDGVRAKPTASRRSTKHSLMRPAWCIPQHVTFQKPGLRLPSCRLCNPNRKMSRRSPLISLTGN
jgi:hypothetical protein